MTQDADGRLVIDTRRLKSACTGLLGAVESLGTAWADFPPGARRHIVITLDRFGAVTVEHGA